MTTVEKDLCALEAAADEFALSLAAYPGEADAIWLRVNRLRDRIVSAYGSARTEAEIERRRLIDEHARQHFAVAS